MEIFYKINKGSICAIPKYWHIEKENNLIRIYIYNYIIVTSILINKNTYIGYQNNDEYTIYYYEKNSKIY